MDKVIEIAKESYKQGGIDAILSVLDVMDISKLIVINKDQLRIVLAKYQNLSMELTEEEKSKL